MEFALTKVVCPVPILTTLKLLLSLLVVTLSKPEARNRAPSCKSTLGTGVYVPEGVPKDKAPISSTLTCTALLAARELLPISIALLLMLITSKL